MIGGRTGQAQPQTRRIHASSAGSCPPWRTTIIGTRADRTTVEVTEPKCIPRVRHGHRLPRPRVGHSWIRRQASGPRRHRPVVCAPAHLRSVLARRRGVHPAALRLCRGKFSSPCPGWGRPPRRCNPALPAAVHRAARLRRRLAQPPLPSRSSRRCPPEPVRHQGSHAVLILDREQPPPDSSHGGGAPR